MAGKVFFSLITFFFVGLLQAQKRDSIRLTESELDSISNLIRLKEVVLYPPPQFESRAAWEAYATLRWMVYRVYPFAKTAASQLEAIRKRIDLMPSKSLKKRYIKILQDYIEGEFSEKLKKYTIWEGQILIKLINRQTGVTCYELMKELKSGFQAFLYDSTANFFRLSLKKEYHPELVYKDFLIEQILMRAFSNGDLPPQESKVDVDYDTLYKQWETTNGSETIKKIDIYSNKD